MWIAMYVVAVVMVLGSGVLAEGPLIPKAAQRVSEIPTTTTGPVEIDTTPKPISSSVRAVDCADHLMAGSTESGVYEIYPFTCTCGKSVLVWCDMETDGGGWTVLLNRQNQEQQENFNRTWEEYKRGFGSAYNEYYLGNELLHQMTNSRPYTIRLDVELASGGYDFATYESFKVNSEDNRYATIVSGALSGGSSTTSCFRYLGGRYFTTLDRDHDSYSGNCAAVKGGGWWYYTCRYFNPTTSYNTTLTLTCYGSTRPVTKLELKLRPSICDSSFKTIHLKDMGCGCESEGSSSSSFQMGP